jgi:hypothetical protein
MTALTLPWTYMGDQDSDIRGLLERFLEEQRRIEVKKAKELADRDRESLRVHKESFGQIADRLLESFSDHEKKDDRRHQELLSSVRSLDDRVGALESKEFRAGWKESPSGLHMIKDIESARREEEMYRRIRQKDELKTWRWLKKHTTEIVVGALVLVLAGAVGAAIGTKVLGEHAVIH